MKKLKKSDILVEILICFLFISSSKKKQLQGADKASNSDSRTQSGGLKPSQKGTRSPLQEVKSLHGSQSKKNKISN